MNRFVLYWTDDNESECTVLRIWYLILQLDYYKYLTGICNETIIT